MNDDELNTLSPTFWYMLVIKGLTKEPEAMWNSYNQCSWTITGELLVQSPGCLHRSERKRDWWKNTAQVEAEL